MDVFGDGADYFSAVAQSEGGRSRWSRRTVSAFHQCKECGDDPKSGDVDLIRDFYGPNGGPERRLDSRVIRLKRDLKQDLKRSLSRSFGLTIAFLWGLFLTGQVAFAIATDLPDAQTKAVPAQLLRSIAQLPIAAASGTSIESDYFDQIQKVKVGYLLWTDFPVRVSIDPAGDRRWQTAVRRGVEAWMPYFPLEIIEGTDGREDAQIQIKATRFKLNRPAGSTALPRFRAAETRWDVTPVMPDSPTSLLHHHMTIALPPGQADGVMQSAACHEMGHALGIWGHSIDARDVMYFAQVKDPPPISPRDLHTLKRIYEQPTRLGEEMRVKK